MQAPRTRSTHVNPHCFCCSSATAHSAMFCLLMFGGWHPDISGQNKASTSCCGSLIHGGVRGSAALLNSIGKCKLCLWVTSVLQPNRDEQPRDASNNATTSGANTESSVPNGCVCEQEDITETIRFVFDKLGGGDQLLLNEVLSNQLRENTQCSECGNIKVREETFTDLVLPVPTAKEVEKKPPGANHPSPLAR
eukprot:Skav200499  [mRNA]  locus=scaffold450:315569:316322:- [translate_table: standard]